MRPERRKARAELAVATREASRHPTDPSTLAVLRTRQAEYETLSLEDHIARVVDSAPPLTAAQVDRLRALLPPPLDADLGGAA